MFRLSLQNYRYLDLLAVLCVCDGVAIPDNQTYITEHWLRQDRVSSPLPPLNPIQSYLSPGCCSSPYPRILVFSHPFSPTLYKIRHCILAHFIACMPPV